MICALAGLALAASFSGCGGGATKAGPEAGGGKTTAAAAHSRTAIDFESCAGFTAEQAAVILGVEASTLETQAVQQSWGKDCSYTTRGGAFTAPAVSFTLTRADSVEAATVEMAQLADHASVSDQVLPNQKVSHWVQGVGDQAIWVAANGSLYVRSGDVTIIVTRPDDPAQQIEVARRIIG